MVDIYVGPSKQYFPIYKHLLGTKVPYFRKMFESTFKESVEQAATLPEDDPNAFVLFVQWLYRDNLTFSISESTTHPKTTSSLTASVLLSREDLPVKPYGPHDDDPFLELQEVS